MIGEALRRLRPGAQFIVVGTEYAGIQWLDHDQTLPTEYEVESEIVLLKQEYTASQYQRQRQLEYPPITDYLDGVVKGDQEQIQSYIDACLAVKAKYPKG